MKILIINTVGFGYEGISTVILNYASFMNKDDLEIHVACMKGMDNAIEERLKSIGKVHYLKIQRKNILNYICALNKLLKNGFSTVHINGNSATMCVETVLCKKNSVKNIIIHGHSMSTNFPLFHKIAKPILLKTANKFLACSKEVGEYLYSGKEYYLINNAIDVNRFSFDEKNRKIIRKQYDIEDYFILGHVGYYSNNKNQIFLLKLLFDLKRAGYKKIKVMCIGNYFTDEFYKMVDKMKLTNDIIIVPANEKVEMYYNAMDMFIFPSRSEGLGLALIEAQANGLRCIASTGVPISANITGKIEYFELCENPNKWTQEICKQIRKTNYYNREKESLFNCKKITDAGFNIEYEAEKLRKIYMEY